MHTAKMLFIVVSLVLAAGCGKPEKKPEPSKTVEDFTGMTSIKNMKKIKKKINEAETAQEKRFKEIEEMGKEQ
ncbi:MAG: hypothetical protein JXA18_04715 [Chitinispirillaceae bacterium]|nr:hypothetical protein [Chitinispirillaceae bacterium]